MPEDEKRDPTTGERIVEADELLSSAETIELSRGGSSAMSDVVLAESMTAAAPTFPAQSPGSGREKIEKRGRGEKLMALLPGARVDDFEIVRLLGRGAFGHVYLARQVSLDRLVALKISANRGSEGRTMARLEHQHIVQVFSETVDPDFNQRLLCMQLVPGIGLERLIGMLHARSEARGARSEDNSLGSRSSLLATSQWTGSQVLAIIDRSTSLPAALDPSALHDREALARMDAVEATAWFGGRLAEALDFAHHHGVLHRDIKPANILVNSYGRPMLADFNISSQPVGSEPSGDEMFGGTFAYMAPEHLDAFNPSDPTGPEAVTASSDLYSLGLVLEQLLEGELSFPLAERKTRMADTLRTMADERRGQRPTVDLRQPGAHKTLKRTIARCLEPEPGERFCNGAELAEQLDGCRRLRQAERQLPRPPAMLAPLLRRPFLWLVILVVVPQIIGSAVNIAYNSTEIVGQLNDAQQKLFAELVVDYNAVVYPIALVILILAVRPVWKCWRALEGRNAVAEDRVAAARRHALRLPRWIAGLVALGWFPGGFIFPLVIATVEPRLEPHIAAHFIASFCLSGLIALAYSLCGAQYIVLRVLYPGMWSDTRHFNQTARSELAPMAARLGRIQMLAGSIPLVAAVLMLTLGGRGAHTTFHYLVTGLIALGMIGSHFTIAVTRSLSQVVAALTGTKD